MRGLNRTFNIIEKATEDLPIPAEAKQEIGELIGKLKEEKVTEYCRDTLHELIEKSKQVLEESLDVTIDNAANPDQVKAFASLVNSLTAAVTALDKINVDKSRDKDNEEDDQSKYLTTDTVFQELDKRRKEKELENVRKKSGGEKDSEN